MGPPHFLHEKRERTAKKQKARNEQQIEKTRDLVLFDFEAKKCHSDVVLFVFLSMTPYGLSYLKPCICACISDTLFGYGFFADNTVIILSMIVLNDSVSNFFITLFNNLSFIYLCSILGFQLLNI